MPGCRTFNKAVHQQSDEVLKKTPFLEKENDSPNSGTALNGEGMSTHDKKKAQKFAEVTAKEAWPTPFP